MTGFEDELEYVPGDMEAETMKAVGDEREVGVHSGSHSHSHS